jgi:hypothetical protein
MMSKWPKVWGTSRDVNNPKSVLVYMASEPTDDQFRAFDEAVKGRAELSTGEAVAENLETVRKLLLLSAEPFDKACSLVAEIHEGMKRQAIKDLTTTPLKPSVNELVEKDAERYRWLRHADLDELAENNWGKGGQVYEGEELDAAIDAAIASHQSAKEQV